MRIDRCNAPIGVFDSGMGGLTVAQEILKYLPNEEIIYFADTAHVPYGVRQDDDIRQLTAKAIAWLYAQGCKAVVVACNTASAFSLDFLRIHYGDRFPILGLVPALKPAVLNSKSKVVAVLATPATFRGKLINDVIQNFAVPAGVQVIPVTCLPLVPLIEQGQRNSPQMHLLLKEVLMPARYQHADHLVLGCTHYPFLKPAIEYVFPHQFKMIDSGLAVARHMAQILHKHQLQRTVDFRSSQVQIVCYFSGGDLNQINSVVHQLVAPQFSWQSQHVTLDQTDLK